MAEIIPADNIRKLRACMLCSLVKSADEFVDSGCENCDEVLNFKGDKERSLECTSANFEGIMALLKPEKSWVARWYIRLTRQRIDKFTRGIYAVQVVGTIPMDIQEELLDKGIKYRPRDGTVKD
jgi:transcription elongation factor SPT4